MSPVTCRPFSVGLIAPYISHEMGISNVNQSTQAAGQEISVIYIHIVFVSKQTNAITQIAIDLSALPYIDLPSGDRHPYPLNTSFPTALPKSEPSFPRHKPSVVSFN